jgi:putative multiple sugar transport system permease protein
MTDVTTQAAQTPSLSRFLKAHVRDYALLISLLVIMIFFQITTDGTLFKPVNMTNLILQNSYIVIMALGMLLIIVAGHIDLSVGSVAGFIGAVAAVMMVNWKVDPFLAGIACLALGAVIGGAQGYFVAYYKIPAFIVTLAGMLVFKGLALTVLGGASVGPFPKVFQLLSSGYVPDIFNFTLNGAPFNLLALVIGIVVTGLIIFFNYRTRQNQQMHGLAEEPDPDVAHVNGQGAGAVAFQLGELVEVLEDQVLHALLVDFDLYLVLLVEVLQLALKNMPQPLAAAGETTTGREDGKRAGAKRPAKRTGKQVHAH